MNKQVIDVYNEMAMPGDCARRIEGEMNRAIRQKKGENRFMKNEKNGKSKAGALRSCWCVWYWCCPWAECFSS